MTQVTIEPVSDAMVDAYLAAQRQTVEEADRFGRPNVGGLHTNTVREACRNGLRAALQAAPAQAEQEQEQDRISGESLPRCKKCGDAVFNALSDTCGTCNGQSEPAQPVNQVLLEALKLAYDAMSGSTDKTLLIRAHKAAEAAIAQAAQPGAGLTDVAELQRQMREVAALTHANPGKAFPIPLLVQIEGKKMMAGEPSLFDQMAFGEVKALGDLTTAAIQKGQQSCAI